MFDPVIGQFISDDPIEFDAGDPNLRRYVENSPTNATDPTGLVPNRYDTVSLAEVVRAVALMEAWNPGRSPREILELYQNRTCWQFMNNFDAAKQLGLIDEEPLGPPMKWAYLFTEKEGWVDLGHFLTTGRATAKGIPPLFTLLGGEFYEDYTKEIGKQNPDLPGMGSSANTFEDPISNRLGVQFGRKLKSDVPLSQQLQKFFDDLGAKIPSDAWNYRFLPPNEATWEKCWKNYPEDAMKRARVILDRNDPVWKTFPPDSERMQEHIKKDEIWGPLLTPPATR